ncbi:MAG: hypothetical protein H7321_00875 [Bacteroidia bacterium]|nr:hypothetical protein [Bacteroidia bacterium]
MKKILICAVCATAILVACKKKDEKTIDPIPAGPTKTELISANEWILKDAVSNGTSYYPFLQACQKDDSYRFLKTNILENYDNAIKCDAADPDTVKSNWSFYNNETQIIVDLKKFSYQDTADIQSLTSDKMVFIIDYIGSPLEITFKKK